MRRQVRRWRAGVLATALAVGLAACQSTQQNRQTGARPTPKPLKPVAQTKAPGDSRSAVQLKPPRSGPIRIALLAPLSGEYADAGGELANGAAMAIFATDGVDAEIMAFDTKANADGARSALAEAAAARADIVVGPLFGANAEAIAPGLQAAGLYALAFSNNGDVAGPRVAVMGRAVETETARIVRHAAESGARRVALFGRADAVGEAATAQALREAAAMNGFFVQRALYQPGADYTEVAKSVRDLVRAGGDGGRAAEAGRLKARLDVSPDPGATLDELALAAPLSEREMLQELAVFYEGEVARGVRRPQAVNGVIGRFMAAAGPTGRPDAVLLTVSGAELSTVAPMFQLYDADTLGLRLMGLASWSALDPARARELHGGRFASPPNGGAFDTKYERLFGVFPTDLASVAYDAVRVALEASQRSLGRPVAPAAAVAVGDVDGAHGPVRIAERGLALRPLEVVELAPDGFLSVDGPRIVEPAAPQAPVLTAPPPASATVPPAQIPTS